MNIFRVAFPACLALFLTVGGIALLLFEFIAIAGYAQHRDMPLWKGILLGAAAVFLTLYVTGVGVRYGYL